MWRVVLSLLKLFLFKRWRIKCFIVFLPNFYFILNLKSIYSSKKKNFCYLFLHAMQSNAVHEALSRVNFDCIDFFLDYKNWLWFFFLLNIIIIAFAVFFLIFSWIYKNFRKICMRCTIDTFKPLFIDCISSRGSLYQ